MNRYSWANPGPGPGHRFRFGMFVVTAVVAGVFGAALRAAEPAAETISPPEIWITGIATTGNAADDGDQMAYASTAQGLLLREASVVRLAASESEPEALYEHPAAVWDIVVTPDGQTIASVDYKGNLATYEIATGKHVMHEAAMKRWCQTLLATSDSKSIVGGNEAGEILVWDLAMSKVTKTKELDGHAISGFAWSPDQSRLAVTDGGGHVHLMQWPSLDSVGEVQVGAEPAWCVAFVDDQTCLIGSGDRNLYRVPVSDFKPPLPARAEPEQEAAKPDGEKPDGEKSEDAQASQEPAYAPESVFQGKDWITQLSFADSGEIAVGEIGGAVTVLQFDSAGKANVADRLDSPSGVWALAWNGDRLLIGTRKDGLRTATRSWKWLNE